MIALHQDEGKSNSLTWKFVSIIISQYRDKAKLIEKGEKIGSVTTFIKDHCYNNKKQALGLLQKVLDLRYQKGFFDEKMDWIVSNFEKARYSKLLLKCLTIWIPLTSVIYDSLEHFLKSKGTLISINGQLVVAVHGNVQIWKADDPENPIDLAETAIYKVPQINGCWIKFPCFVNTCNVDLVMELYSMKDPSYQLFHEEDFHWCTYTPKQTY